MIKKLVLFLFGYSIIFMKGSLEIIPLTSFLKANPSFYQKIIESKINYEDLETIYQKCAKSNKSKYIDNTPFIIEQKQLCKGKVSIFIGIHSNNPNFHRRQMIRETFGSVQRVHNFTIKLGFFVGRSINQEYQMKLNEESDLNGDIIQRKFVDSYRNMTRKHITLLEWVTRNCNHAQYLLKADDDVFIDIFHVIREIVDGKVLDGFLCSSSHSRPNRSKKGALKKWYVTKKEYSYPTYPTYCEGFGYIVPVKYVSDIFVCSMLNDFFWIDDVYVGGILPNLLGIPRKGFTVGGGSFYMSPSSASHKILDGIFYVEYYNEIVKHQWRKMWKAVIDYSMTIY